jgi:antitoxin ParD1/3/4
MNLNISLPDELGEFVRERVATGRYTSASEVVREALRLMKQAEAAKLGWLQGAFQEGLASGNVGQLNFAALKVEARKRKVHKA